MGKDPVYLVQKETMLWELYTGGWTAIADAFKQFHNFPTHHEERKYLGCIHRVTDEQLVYAGLPMGTTNSPPIACRINNSALRELISECDLFGGDPQLNTWGEALKTGVYDGRNGHGRILMGRDGFPAVLIFCIVDDYFIHGPTKSKCWRAFSSAFMDFMLRLGFICQKVKTSPPKQVQTFCGMDWDTHRVPTLRIPDAKVQRASATIDYMLMLDDQKILSRLSAAVGGGLLQSLVDATPSRQGQTCLRSMYDHIHLTTELMGRELYYSVMQLRTTTREYLMWWRDFLELNPGNRSPSGAMESLVVTWGDGSGTGTGGTSERLERRGELETWIGTWSPHAQTFDSNWKELRTLLWTLERKLEQKENMRGATLFYFTDNMVTYYIVHNGSSRSPELHKLIRQIKAVEFIMRRRVEVVHVPGVVMITQGTDGLSRGVWASADRLERTSLEESRQALEGMPHGPLLGSWVARELGLPRRTAFVHHHDRSAWRFEAIGGQWTLWTPSPEVARQAISTFLNLWVEQPDITGGVFVVPRILQRQWGNMSQYVTEIGVYVPHSLPWGVRYDYLIPVVLLACFPHVRCLPPAEPVESPVLTLSVGQWHTAQAELLRRL
jgi:hypothetical protein